MARREQILRILAPFAPPRAGKFFVYPTATTQEIPVTIKRGLIRLLDRPGGRTLLAAIATTTARRASQADVQVFFDDCWLHRVDGYFFPDGKVFRYFHDSFVGWKDEPKRRFAKVEEYWCRNYTPKRGDVVVDVGAGRGEDTFAFSQLVGDTGHVISIEPHPDSFSFLVQLCEKNRLNNVTKRQLAVAAENGHAGFSDHQNWLSNSITVADQESAFVVLTKRLDNVSELRNVERVDLLKMNIEGGEVAALSGSEELLTRTKHVAIACHDFRADLGEGEHFRTKEAVSSYLISKGFRIESIANDPRPYVRDHVYGSKTMPNEETRVIE